MDNFLWSNDLGIVAYFGEGFLVVGFGFNDSR